LAAVSDSGVDDVSSLSTASVSEPDPGQASRAWTGRSRSCSLTLAVQRDGASASWPRATSGRGRRPPGSGHGGPARRPHMGTVP